jgi:hypothetical protein
MYYFFKAVFFLLSQEIVKLVNVKNLHLKIFIKFQEVIAVCFGLTFQV